MRAKRAVHLALAAGVAAVFLASVQSCVARRNEFLQYPGVAGVGQFPRDIRVLLLSENAFRISVAGGYKIVAGGRVLFNDIAPMPEVTVQAMPNGLMMGVRLVPDASVEVLPTTAGTLKVNGNAYYGKLVLLRKQDEKKADVVQAINVVPTEDYLAGVIACEMPSYWPMPALRAQAIAARSYVLYRARHRSGGDYDVAAGTADQVYKGISGEALSTRRAVEQTKGVILLYDWKILPAYFHSICGGHTASRRAVFHEADITPLMGVACPYCSPKIHGDKIADLYRWQAAVPEREIVGALVSEGYKVNGIESIKPLSPDSSGHAGDVLIQRKNDKPLTMSIDNLRAAVGYGKLISNCFSCVKQGSVFKFNGKGFGHGVGMCQWGARGLAMKGYGSKAILKYYYPGADILKVY